MKIESGTPVIRLPANFRSRTTTRPGFAVFGTLALAVLVAIFAVAATRA